MRSIAGYSGSPVIALIPADRAPGFESLKQLLKREHDLPAVFMLLGIDCGHFLNFDQVFEKSNLENPAPFVVRSNTGMAIVIAAWKLAELLDTRELKRMREQERREFEQRTARG